MKAAVINQNGGIEHIHIEEVADPKPDVDEVVVDVKAAALNHLDIWVRRGRPGLELMFPHVLGSDAAGIVSAVGRHVKDIKEGTEVVINPGLSCGTCEFCRRGEHSECLYFGIVGMSRPGTFAEKVALPAANIMSKPSHLTPAEAAALPLAHITAWRMLFSRAKTKPGERILIHGIGGGVALAALQLAKLIQAEVIVTSSSDEKLRRARELGADHAINYSANPDVALAVKDITGGRGVDVAFDTTGAATWQINFDTVRRGGRIVHCGVTSGASAQVSISALYWNHVTVMGSTMGTQEDFRQMLDTVHMSKLKPVVDTAFAHADVRIATMRMENGEQFGKIVLEI
ncbi:MAG: alcohol dehydrogenase [Candidatus Hydrogenedentota bacterium]